MLRRFTTRATSTFTRASKIPTQQLFYSKSVKRGKSPVSTITVDATQNLDDTNTNTSLNEHTQLSILQNTVDKLARKQDSLLRNMASLREVLTVMTTSVQMISEQHVNQRVLTLLKKYKLLSESNTKASPFVKINSLPRIEEYVKSFTKEVEIPGIEAAISKSIGDQQFVGLDGQTLTYAGAAPSSSTWITSIMKQSRGGKKRSIMSGEVSVLGNLENIVKSLHRAMRYPLLVRRYTNRLYQALYKTDGHEGMEHVTVFVVVGNVFTDIPTRFFNRVLSPTDIAQLEEAVLELFEGEVYIPTDEEIIADLDSDPIRNPLGVWRALSVTEVNGKLASKVAREGEFLDDNAKDYVQLLVLLRIAAINKFDLFLGSIVNPLQ